MNKIKLAKSLICFQIYFMLLSNIIIQTFALPASISFLSDLSMIIVFVQMLTLPALMKSKIFNVKNFIFTLIMLFFVLWCFISTGFGTANLSGKLHCLYQIIRVLVLYCTYMTFLERTDITCIYQRFSVLQYFNFFLVLYQCYVLKTNVDFTNGIFGTMDYYNSYTDAFCLLLLITNTVAYIRNKKKFFPAFVQIFMASIICGIAEIKAFFFLAVLAVGFIILIEIRNSKSLILAISLIGALASGIRMMFQILPNNMSVFTDFSTISAYESYRNVTSEGVGRTGAIGAIARNIFHYDWSYIFLGKGLGEMQYAYDYATIFYGTGVIGIGLLSLFCISIIVMYAKALYSYRNAIPAEVLCALTYLLCSIPMFCAHGFYFKDMAFFNILIIVSGMIVLNDRKNVGAKKENLSNVRRSLMPVAAKVNESYEL